jgi:hypothetical protein
MITAIVFIQADVSRLSEIAEQIADIDGVLSTQTQIAFQTFSQHDLEEAFSIGL